jgi:hypothetical protein
MLTMHLLAAAGIYYFIKNAGKLEIPFDLVIGFFTVSLVTVLAIQWFVGWPDYIDGAYLTVTNFYMAGFVGLVGVVMSAVYVYYLYKFLFVESKDVTV